MHLSVKEEEKGKKESWKSESSVVRLWVARRGRGWSGVVQREVLLTP